MPSALLLLSVGLVFTFSSSELLLALVSVIRPMVTNLIATSFPSRNWVSAIYSRLEEEDIAQEFYRAHSAANQVIQDLMAGKFWIGWEIEDSRKHYWAGQFCKCCRETISVPSESYW
jgi:hypothetical protein